MKAVAVFLTLLLTVHIGWLYAYLCGTVLRGRDPAPPPALPGEALVEIVVRTASGIALTGFATFALGLCHLISPLGAGLWLVLLIAAFAYLGDPPWKGAFWSARLAVWRAAASPGALVVYLAALPLAFYAARPDSGSDATTGYLVYATDWVRAHALSVDVHIRPTYYADNWILIDTWLVEFGRSDAAAMLSWLTGCLSLLGAYGYVLSTGERAGARAPRATVAIGLLAVASLVFSPAFVRYTASALIDVPIGFLFFATVLALVRAARSGGRSGVAEAVACGAFFIGAKISLIVFVPVFAAALAVLLRGRLQPRRTAAAVALLVVLAVPWYVKNFIQAGDPVTPVLNLALRGADPKWTRKDLSYVQNDLKSNEGGPVERAAVPFDIVLHPSERQFREPGTTFMMVLLALPAAVLAFYLMRRRGGDLGLQIFAALLTFAIAYWMDTSYVTRYSLEFLAAFTAFAAGLIAAAARHGAYARWAALACAVLLALPSPGSAAFYHDIKNADDDFYYNYTDQESWLLPRGPIYPEVEYVSALMQRDPNGRDLTVYRANVETDRLEWTQRGITAVGDLVGPERYADFHRAIYDDMLGAYVARFRIGVFVLPIDNPNMSPGLQRRFDEEARALGFRRVVLPNRPIALYLSPELPG